MGKPGIRFLQFGILLFAWVNAYAQEAIPQRPHNLTKPPPLPKEMLGRAPAQPPPDLPDPQEMIAQLKQLEELLSLSPGKLKSLRETLEFIEKMSLEEREAMRIRLSQITQMTKSLKSEIDELSKFVAVPERSNLSQFWLAESAEDRERTREILDTLTDEEKRKFLSEKVTAFVNHRDEVFQQMKKSLEAKHQPARPPDS